MNVRRIFANAIARRVAYVLVALVLAWVGLGDARAQAYEACYGNGFTAVDCPTRQDAYEQALRVAVENNNPGASQGVVVNCTKFDPALPIYRCNFRNFQGNQYVSRRWVTECPEGFQWDDVNKTCGQPCQGLDPLPAGAANAPGEGDRFCQGDCAYVCSGASLTLTIDGVLRTACAAPWNPTGSTCSAGDPAPLAPVNDSDGDGTSDDNDLSPNNPGESGDGSGQDVSRACGGPGQPECAPDGSNEGSGKGNTSGGGGDCNTPPRSSGDAILAQIAFQTWATRCAVQATANQGTGTGSQPGTGDDDGQPDWTKGDGPPVATDETDYVSDQTQFELPITTDLLDQENIFGASSCPNFSVTVWGQTVSTAEWDHWCTLANILRVMVGLFGAMTAIKILLGKW